MCPEEEENNGSTPPKKQTRASTYPTESANRPKRKKLIKLLQRAIPYLQDEADKYEDDGSNEPLELIRAIRSEIGD